MAAITQEQFDDIWNYYLTIEEDLKNTSRYIEPQNQDKTYSFEFAKIILLAATEIEAIFKLLSKGEDEKEYGDIGKYKSKILEKYPRIGETVVCVPRWGKYIKPFDNWESTSLFWWDSYQKIKHSMWTHFCKATYETAAYSTAALYVLILYLSKNQNIDFEDDSSKYICSDYTPQTLTGAPPEKLPDFR